jgi:hypothetical protein
MPNGKLAGERCIQLDSENKCKIFGKPERPSFCGSLQPNLEMCGESREQALTWIGQLEKLTRPN